VHYGEVYPGIDLVYYGDQRQLEYDFVVAPERIRRRSCSASREHNKLEIDAQGDLVLHAAGGDIRQHKPIIYQNIDGIRREIAGSYVRKGANRVGFQLAAYDTTRPLVIDPVCFPIHYLGGNSGESGCGDRGGRRRQRLRDGLHRVPQLSNDLRAFQTANARAAAAFAATFRMAQDAFVTKLDPSGSGPCLLHLPTVGQREGPRPRIAVEPRRQRLCDGGHRIQRLPDDRAGFRHDVQRLRRRLRDQTRRDGSMLSIHLPGGGNLDWGYGIAVDSGGNAYVTGYTGSTNFPTTPRRLIQALTAAQTPS